MAKYQIFQKLSPEAQVLFLLCSNNFDSVKHDQITALTMQPFNWELFTTMAVRSHLAAFIYQSLRKLPTILIPDKSLQKLKLYQLKMVSTNAVLFNEFDRLAKVCANKGLQIIPLKGIYFAEKIYVNAPVRQLSDIDVLFKPSDKVAFLETVQELGWTITPFYYKSNFHKKYQPFHAPFQGVKGKLCLDIHDRFINDNFAFQFPVASVLEKCSTITCRENHVLALDPVDCLIFTCLHAYKHLYYGDIKISSLLDIYQFLLVKQNEFSAKSLKERCLEFNCEIEVYQLLACTNELFDCTTIVLLNELSLPPIKKNFMQVISTTLNDQKMSIDAKIQIEFIHRNTTKIGWKKIGLIWFDIFPSKEYLAIKHGKKWYLSNWLDRSLRFFKRIT